MKETTLSALLWAWNNKKRVFLYFWVGLLSSGVHTGILTFVYKVAGLHYQLGNLLGFVVALGLNYYLNRRFTFEGEGSLAALNERARFVLKKSVFYPLSVVALYVFVEYGRLEPWVAQLMLIPPVGLIGFLVLERYVFPKKSLRR